jgi:hypothetical protein
MKEIRIYMDDGTWVLEIDGDIAGFNQSLLKLIAQLLTML